MATKQNIKKAKHHRNWKNISFVDPFTGMYHSGRYRDDEIALLERFIEVKILKV
jgi:hypothetical protein